MVKCASRLIGGAMYPCHIQGCPNLVLYVLMVLLFLCDTAFAAKEGKNNYSFC